MAATAAAAGAEGPVWILQLRYQVEIGVYDPYFRWVLVPVMSRLRILLCTTTVLECAVVLDVLNLLADGVNVENVHEL